MSISFLPTAALAALVLFATPTSHAQGLGSVLGRAKAGVSQAAPAAPAGAAQAAAPAGYPALPPTLTPETNAEYMGDLLAYADHQTFRPSSDPDPTPNEVYNYLNLRQLGYPLRINWDQAVINLTTDSRSYLSGYVVDMTSDLVKGLKSIYGPKLQVKLAKVKEIHFTTSPKKRSLDEPSTLDGYFFSFNPATGVLQAPMSQPDGAIATSQDLALTKWLVTHVK